MVSTTTMIKRLEGLLDTKDLSYWEKQFVRSMMSRERAGEVTKITGSQVEKLDEIHSKHFAS